MAYARKEHLSVQELNDIYRTLCEQNGHFLTKHAVFVQGQVVSHRTHGRLQFITIQQEPRQDDDDCNARDMEKVGTTVVDETSKVQLVLNEKGMCYTHSVHSVTLFLRIYVSVRAHHFLLCKRK